MEIDIRCDCAEIDWTLVAETLRRVGMAHHAPEVHQQAFAASHTVVFAWNDDQMVGFGRAISDGLYQAAVYDVAVVPEFQHQGIGTLLLNAILARLSSCNVILYAAPGKEAFYQGIGFRRMRTGMALFNNADAMTAKGFTE
jgi:ribosomal protein S18 acetylase RimI-like enzyme